METRSIQKTETKKVVKTLVTHERPHVDELVAMLLLINSQNELNVEINSIEFVGNSVGCIDDSRIFVGVCGSKYDEHTRNGKLKLDECGNRYSAARLVAEDLGIWNNGSADAHIAKYAHINDTEGSKNMAELGNLLKNKFAYVCKKHGNTSEFRTGVFKWFQEVFEKRLYSFESNLDYKLFSKEIRGKFFSKEGLLKEVLSFRPVNLSWFKNIIISQNFSLEDVIAVYMIKHFSKMKKLNHKTKVFFAGSNYQKRKGDLCIGFGDGPFANLPVQKMKRQLRIGDTTDFKLLFDYSFNIQSRAGYNPFELAGLLVDRHFNGDSYFESFKWAMNELKLLTKKQRLFNEAVNDFHVGLKSKKNYIKHISKEYKIAFVESDSPIISSAAFSERCFAVDIVVVKNSKGQVGILTKGNKFKLTQSVVRLRKKELLLSGIDMNNIDFSLLDKEGGLDICPEWFYHKETEAVFNGSITHTKVSPTRLSMRQIENIIFSEYKKYIQKYK